MLGIIGAMEIETNGLIEKMDETRVDTFGVFSFVCGKLCGKNIVVCKCGIGKVFSSTAAILMIEKYGVDAIINIGVAGGAKLLKQGDIVIAEKTVQHDYDATADVSEGLVLGQVHGFTSPFFECDNELISVLKMAVFRCGLSSNVGIIASGDCFVSSKVKSENISKTFGAIAFDMESAPINQVCAMQKVKYCAMRAISDNADDIAAMSFYDFVCEASKRAIDVICEFVKLWNL